MRASSILAITGLLLASFATKGQVSLTPLGPTYTQDFNSLPTASSTTWTDNSTLANWYSNRTAIIGSTGSSNTGGLYSFGASSDRAIGSLGSGSAAPIYGVRLKNDGATNITSLAVSFTGEQWRTANTITNTLAFSYQVSGTAFSSVTTGSYTNFTGLNFVSPNLAGGGVAIDGNNTSNQVAVSATITVTIPPGSEIMLRWSDIDDAGSDHGLGIDDLTITAAYPCTPPTAAISGTAAICSGGTSAINFTGTANAIVTYTINGGGNQTITLDGTGNASLSTGVLNANATYALVSADNGSCSQALTGSAVVTVNPLPTASVSGTTTICSGYDANISFTGTPNATVTYDVDGGAPQTVVLDGTGNATVNTGAITTSTTYTVLSVSDGTCSDVVTGSAVVTVDPLPTVTISGSVAICSGQNATITFTGTPNATVNYTVNGSPQIVTLDGTGNATVNTGALTSTTSYDITDVSNGTCTETVTGNATVTVSPLPTAAISGTIAVCSGNSAIITFTGTANATVTYTIDGGAPQTIVLDGTGNATVNTGVLTTTTSYDLVSVTEGLCSDGAAGTATVTVNTNPVAAISGSAVICSGNSANLFFSGTPNAVVNYTVNGNPQSVTLDGTGNATVNSGVLTAPATFALVDVTLNTCTAAATGNAVINVNPAPTASISGTTTIAPGNVADITFTGTPNAVVSYTVNGGPVQTVTLDGSGSATVNTGVLYYDAVYTITDVTLGCTQPVSGSAAVTMTTAYGPIYTYTNAPTGAYDFVAANATGTNLSLLNGAVLSTAPCAFGYTAEEFNANISYDPTTNAAIGMQVNPVYNHRLIITGFSVGVRRSVDGPQSVRMAYSLDNGASWVSSGLDEMPNNSTCDDVTTLTWNTTPFQAVSVANGLRFAVFGFDASTMSGQLQVLNLVINGTVIETPLPITLEYFKGACDGNRLSFDWKVSKENNISGYQLQYSDNGRTFTNVASQPVAIGDGAGKIYNLALYNGAEGLYRLASEEHGGVAQYSEVIRVKCSDNTIVPTKVGITNQVLVVVPGTDLKMNERMTVQVCDMNGVVVSQYTDITCQQLVKEQVSLAQGVYVVRIVQGATVNAYKVFCESAIK